MWKIAAWHCNHITDLETVTVHDIMCDMMCDMTTVNPIRMFHHGHAMVRQHQKFISQSYEFISVI